ncbi:Rne/Rng family ribonuclease [Tissierella sp. MSJ-40]|uniref:Rne/Rng family ribonuclease n=1 Tax=Tissierella simiarum TaxID=2841534 RepID=A0ABS6ECW6_9FIRM|nr:Rne/Rng family ribonuclease [Tissierella simiarum]MBU5440018.1 Rne/Rng family ribonuclease [Tissierella simiarum]
MNYIFIDFKDDINRVGIVEEGRLVEFYTEEKNSKKLVGNVYRGRVNNVLMGMEAAFVDIGEGKNAYLYIKNALPKELMYSKEEYKINDIIKNGEEVIVQVIKEGFGNKGPKVTTHIALPGRYIVFTPYSNKINLSRKIEDSKEIERLYQIGKRITKDNKGMILRTVSEGIEESILEEEYNMLFNIYKKIEREKNFLPCPKLVYRELDLVYQVIRDRFNEDISKIIVNNREIYDNLLLFEDYISSGLWKKLELDKNFAINKDEHIQKGIKEALERKVSLNSGGYIVIDETEALTAIDVNTGKYVGVKSLEDTVLKTNLEAAEEIARQIRLRDIGGIIIIDFIDMKDKKDVSMVLDKLEEVLKKDKNKTNMVDITKLGLVEITRKKVRRTLEANYFKKCPTCEGKGKILDINY